MAEAAGGPLEEETLPPDKESLQPAAGASSCRGEVRFSFFLFGRGILGEVEHDKLCRVNAIRGSCSAFCWSKSARMGAGVALRSGCRFSAPAADPCPENTKAAE